MSINISQYEKEKLSRICSYRICTKETKNEYESAVVNEAKVFEPLRLYYNCISGNTRGRIEFCCTSSRVGKALS